MAIKRHDKLYLRQALKLAQKGLGLTNPNPMVGAILVKNDKIIGQGYHHKVGASHAEVNALKNAKGNVAGATLYVNLEPCCHFGRTGPCTEAIIKAGIKRVVCADRDPHTKVNGKGIQALRRAGIQVDCGALQKEARKLNEAFYTFHTKKRPFVVAKFACSLDGRIATKTSDSKWITNNAARNYARGLRGMYQGVAIGGHTIIADNPHLGARHKNAQDPLRVVLDSQLSLPLTSKVLRDHNVLIATSSFANPKKLKALRQAGFSLVQFKGKTIPVRGLLKELYKREIVSILVEGGGAVLGSFFDAHVVDKVFIFYAPIIIGGSQAVSAIRGDGVATVKAAPRLKNIFSKKFGDNWLVSGSIN